VKTPRILVRVGNGAPSRWLKLRRYWWSALYIFQREPSGMLIDARALAGKLPFVFL